MFNEIKFVASLFQDEYQASPSAPSLLRLEQIDATDPKHRASTIAQSFVTVYFGDVFERKNPLPRFVKLTENPYYQITVNDTIPQIVQTSDDSKQG